MFAFQSINYEFYKDVVYSWKISFKPNSKIVCFPSFPNAIIRFDLKLLQNSKYTDVQQIEQTYNINWAEIYKC